MRFVCFHFCQSFEVWSQLRPFRSLSVTMTPSKLSLTTPLSHWRWDFLCRREKRSDSDCFSLLVSHSSALYNVWCSFQGVLPGSSDDAPTIVITAHYDSFGLAPVSHMKMISHLLRTCWWQFALIEFQPLQYNMKLLRMFGFVCATVAVIWSWL